MQSFTAMSDEAILATVKAQEATGGKYPVEFAQSDFKTFMWALADLHDNSQNQRLADWAGSFASGIAETLGVEMI